MYGYKNAGVKLLDLEITKKRPSLLLGEGRFFMFYSFGFSSCSKSFGSSLKKHRDIHFDRGPDRKQNSTKSTMTNIPGKVRGLPFCTTMPPFPEVSEFCSTSKTSSVEP